MRKRHRTQRRPGASFLSTQDWKFLDSKTISSRPSTSYSLHVRLDTPAARRQAAESFRSRGSRPGSRQGRPRSRRRRGGGVRPSFVSLLASASRREEAAKEKQAPLQQRLEQQLAEQQRQDEEDADQSTTQGSDVEYLQRQARGEGGEQPPDRDMLIRALQAESAGMEPEEVAAQSQSQAQAQAQAHGVPHFGPGDPRNELAEQGQLDQELVDTLRRIQQLSEETRGYTGKTLSALVSEARNELDEERASSPTQPAAMGQRGGAVSPEPVVVWKRSGRVTIASDIPAGLRSVYDQDAFNESVIMEEDEDEDFASDYEYDEESVDSSDSDDAHGINVSKPRNRSKLSALGALSLASMDEDGSPRRRRHQRRRARRRKTFARPDLQRKEDEARALARARLKKRFNYGAWYMPTRHWTTNRESEVGSSDDELEEFRWHSAAAAAAASTAPPGAPYSASMGPPTGSIAPIQRAALNARHLEEKATSLQARLPGLYISQEYRAYLERKGRKGRLPSYLQ